MDFSGDAPILCPFCGGEKPSARFQKCACPCTCAECSDGREME